MYSIRILPGSGIIYTHRVSGTSRLKTYFARHFTLRKRAVRKTELATYTLLSLMKLETGTRNKLGDTGRQYMSVCSLIQEFNYLTKVPQQCPRRLKLVWNPRWFPKKYTVQASCWYSIGTHDWLTVGRQRWANLKLIGMRVNKNVYNFTYRIRGWSRTFKGFLFPYVRLFWFFVKSTEDPRFRKS